MAQTPHMALGLLEQSQAQKEVTVNEALFRLDAVLNSGALDRGLDTPPGSPAEGDVYIIGASPTGAWAGKAEYLAYFHQIWRFIDPNAGLLIWVVDEAAHFVFNGTHWVAAAVSGGGGGGGGGGDMAKAAYDGANINQQVVGVSASQTLVNKTINGSSNTISNISLSASVTGTLPAANGGTGVTSPGTAGNVLTSNGSAWVSQAPSGGGGGAAREGFRNMLINGDFRFNQRALTSVASDVYHLDRWYALAQSGNVTISQLSDAEDGQLNSLRMQQPDASAKRIAAAQIVEGKQCRHLRGKSVTFSGRYRCSASQSIHMAVLEWTGTEDSVTSAIVNNWTSTTYTPSNFFIGTSVNVIAIGAYTPPAASWENFEITGTVGSTANNLVVVCWSTGTLALNATLDLGLAQLEEGSSKTPFERRPTSIEQLLCQRYYLKKAFANNEIIGVAQAYSNTSVFGSMFTPQAPMRVSSGATMSISDATHYTFSTATGSTQTAATLTTSLVANTVVITNSTSSGTGLVAGYASVVRSNNNSAFIAANAEL